MSLKNQWYQFWLSVLAHVLVQSQDIEACHSFGKPDIDKFQEAILCVSWKKNCKKVLFNKKKLSSIDDSKQFLHKTQKVLPTRIWQPWMSQFPTTAESWSAVVSLMVASREMALSESNVEKIDQGSFQAN